MAKTALVTGATSGIGRSFAEQLAAEKYDLVIVARDAERLATTKSELTERHGVDVEVIVADLSTEAGTDTVVERVEDAERPVHFLVNNAGFGSNKSFTEMTGKDHDDMIECNVNALVRLSHAAVREMLQRNEGDVINLGSVAGFLPGFRSSSTYAATKAFVIAFTEGLMPITKGSKVHASVLCPGFVKTEFHKRANISKGKITPWLWLDADFVVREALRDHRKGRIMSVPSFRYKVIVALARVVPRNLLLKQMHKMGKR